MLVKIDNDTKEFLNLINELKYRAEVGTSSKAALWAITNCQANELRADNAEARIEELEQVIAEVSDLIVTRDSANARLEKLINDTHNEKS